MCNPALYHPAGVETEVTIDRYQEAVLDTVSSIVAACKRNDQRLDKSYAREELKNTLQSFGRVALLCSGGGTMGMNHIGVIKTLYENGRLPRVVSGSSAGAIVCAVLCSR
jgi:TAG lipase/steryl ester hydrolase/phospholipase A2/LPA acyltransferase